MSFLDKYAPLLHSVLRIMSGSLFLEHGTSKLLGFPPNPDFANLQIASTTGVSGIIELIAGLLIALGFYSRFAAFIASGMMAVGYFMVHFPQNFFPMLNMGDAAILYCFVFLYLAAAGPGPYAVNQK
jgi:putative oxidoreductase